MRQYRHRPRAKGPRVGSDSTDVRPLACRFRQQDEGRAYPASSCTACGRSIFGELGSRCSRLPAEAQAQAE